jgi:choline kinase
MPIHLPHATPVAVILAAGVAHRLAPLTDRTHKAVLAVAGRPILARMLEALAGVRVEHAVLVVGHCADQVRAVAAASALDVRFIENPEYRRGSALSLYAARETLAAGPTLVMDADVVFPREFLRRLVAIPARSALLVDEGFEDSGEEVKIFIRGDRAIALGKKVTPARWDRVGEGIGFFKCGREAGRDLVHLLERVGRESDWACEYEDALHLLVGRHDVRAVDVTGLPWTEVDFAEDLRRADLEVAPRIDTLEGL